MNFGKLQINPRTERELSVLVDSGRLSHAVLFTGESSDTRKKVAGLTAQSLLCNSSGEKPCGKCAACHKVSNHCHPDIIEVNATSGKQKNTISIDMIRNVRSQLFLLPNEADFRIFIIYDAEAMTIQSQNALLKILEEPPAFVRFILTCNEKDSLLETIISRVSCFNLSVSSTQNLKVNEKAANAATNALNAISKRNEYALMISVAPLSKDKNAIKSFTEYVIDGLKDALRLQLLQSEESSGSVLRISIEYSGEEILKMIDSLENVNTRADRNANDKLLLTSISAMLATKEDING